MKALVLYYSYSGHTKAIAEDLAAKEPSVLVEIKDVRRPGKLKVYTAGIIAAIRGKAWKIQPLDIDWAEHEDAILLSPIWAGNTPPAFNTALKLLPEGLGVSVILVSASGVSDCEERVGAAIIAQGCELNNIEDIRSR